MKISRNTCLNYTWKNWRINVKSLLWSLWLLVDCQNWSYFGRNTMCTMKDVTHQEQRPISFKCMASCGNQHILCLTFHTVSHDSVSISSTVHANYNQLQQFASNQSNCTEVFGTTLYDLWLISPCNFQEPLTLEIGNICFFIYLSIFPLAGGFQGLHDGG